MLLALALVTSLRIKRALLLPSMGLPPTLPASSRSPGWRRRADDLPPPGHRTGEGSASVVPYLALSLAAKPKAGPPGGLERRAQPPRR